MKRKIIVISQESKIPKEPIRELLSSQNNTFIAATPQSAIALEKLGIHFKCLRAAKPKELYKIQKKLSRILTHKNKFIFSLIQNFTVWELQLWYFRKQQIERIAKNSKQVIYFVWKHQTVPAQWRAIGENIKKEAFGRCRLQIVLK